MTQGPSGGGPPSDQGTEVQDRTARNIGVGCFTTFIGLWSGAMIAVLVGKIVAGIRGAPACDGVPICNWNVYAAVGALLGATTLPILALNRLRRKDVRRDNISRG
jgi:hypothetical protein